MPIWIQTHWQWLAAWLLAVNLAGFFLMGCDKSRARAHQRRIPEKTLFAAAWLGGVPGCLAGMYLFRHKTRHWYFRWGMPLILLIQLLAGWVAVRMKWLC